MKHIAIIFLFLCSTTLYSQINYAKEADYKAFMNSKTLVVLEDKLFSDYNEAIRESVEALWKITPFEFISNREFETKKNLNTFSFIILSDASMDAKGRVMKYNMLNLMMGGKAKTINDMPDLGSVPLSYSDEDEADYIYKTGGILQLMQYFVRYNLAHPNTDLLQLIKNIKTPIGTKSIWLLKNEADDKINSTEKIRKYYTGKVQYVTTEEISKAIAKRDTNVVFLHKIGNNLRDSYCWKALINAGSGELLYFDQYKIDAKHPDAFTAEDFSKLKTK